MSMPKRIPAEAFVREIDAWANYGLDVTEIAEITGIPRAALYRRHEAKSCRADAVVKLGESRLKLEQLVESLVEEGMIEARLDKRSSRTRKLERVADGMRENYEESNAPESCGDPSPLAYMRGCKCKDCYYVARKYSEKRGRHERFE